MKVIEMKNVKKDYPLGKTTVHALKKITFTVRAGDFLSIVGSVRQWENHHAEPDRLY